jgi:hypothetical protein
MITKQEILSSIRDEINITKHLASKLKKKHLKYKPNEKQRSMLELLQYLSYCGHVATSFVINGNWDEYEKLSAKANKVNLSNFASSMDLQMKNIEKLLKKFNDKSLGKRKSKTPWGAPQNAGLGLANTTLKFLSCYRMQLFLYMKAVGFSELNYSNCWIGVDQKKKK